MEELQLLPPSKQMIDSEIADLTVENRRLKSEKERIYEEKRNLQSRVSELEKNNADLQQEIERLRTEESFQNLVREKDILQKELELRKEEADGLFLEIEKLERSNEENLVELRETRSERDGLLEEKKDRERRFDSMTEDSTSIVLSMLVAQTDLQERFERKTSAIEKDGKNRASPVLKQAVEILKRLVLRWRRRGASERCSSN